MLFILVANFCIRENMAQDAKQAGQYLVAVLSQPEYPDCPRALCLLRFLTRYRTLPFDDVLVSRVIEALMCALKWTPNSKNTSLFPLVMDSFCNLIDNDNLRGRVIRHLCDCDGQHENGTAEPSHRNTPSLSRLSLVLEVKASSQLVASLRMIISLTPHQPVACHELKPKILKLAKKGRGQVGSVAVEALVALDPSKPLTLDVRFSNILRYLENTLPRIDVEVGQSSTSPPNNQGDLSSSRGKFELGDGILDKLVSTTGSWSLRERTAAILTLLKLCGDDTGMYSQKSLGHLHWAVARKEDLTAGNICIEDMFRPWHEKICQPCSSSPTYSHHAKKWLV
ncbi:hypothetical protein HD554DRAFT_624067 [Boletus coccyginus]|nr:hypothetical protein HD554DRAFT_624067 [Boletus coccyginus]